MQRGTSTPTVIQSSQKLHPEMQPTYQPTCIINTTKILRTLFHHERFANRGIMLAVRAVFFFRHGIQRTQRQLQRRLSTMATLKHRNIEKLIGAFVLIVVVIVLQHKHETYKQHQKIQLGLERRPK